MKLIL
jgi:hypothetical protein